MEEKDVATFIADARGYNVNTDTFAGVQSVLVARSTYAELSMADGEKIKLYGSGFTYETVGGVQTLKNGNIERILVLTSDGFRNFDIQDVAVTGRVFNNATEAGDLASSLVAWALRGNDAVTGSNKTDVLAGYAGNDVISVANGNDTADGGSGNDIISGGNGNDLLRGREGNDKLYGGDGNDRLEGGSDNDYLSAGNGDDVVYGNALGVTGGSGDHDLLYGGAGNDSVDGQAGNDTVYGGDGVDRVVGGSGRDVLYGGDGDDRVSGNFSDTMYGGDGNDQLTNLLDQPGNARLHGDFGDDTLQGGIGNDWLIGGADDDTLSGGNDDDTLAGNDGNDLIFAGEGVDTFTFSTNWERDEVADYEEGENLQFRGVRIIDMTFEDDAGDLVITQNGTANVVVLIGASSLNSITVNGSELIIGEEILI
jgi:Ca2+-binding RTX toxin-like protein